MLESRARGDAEETVCGLHYTFDVFDTVLTRMVGRPLDVFQLLGARLNRQGLIGISACAFAEQRLEAERRATAIARAHPRIEEIYNEIRYALEIPPAQAQRILEEELRLEAQLIRPVPGSQRMVAEARSQCPSITFISDTYMPEQYIVDLLERYGFWHPGDRLFASCQIRLDKAHGLMFPHIAAEAGIHPRRFLHHGNDIIADKRNALLSAWRVRHVGEGNANRYERLLSEASPASEGLTSLFAGASRQARLSASERYEAPRERIIAEVAAGVIAPTLTSWVLWTLRKAKAEGCDRIYFVSRDGQVLLGIAKQLDVVLKTGLDLRYLYASRQAVLWAQDPSRALLDQLRLHGCRLIQLAELMGIGVDELTARIPLLAGHDVIPPDLHAPLHAFIKNDPEFRSYLRTLSEHAHELLSRYLDQEGWNDGTPAAVVDVGWRGSLAKAYASLGDEFGQPQAYLYFGLAAESRDGLPERLKPRLHAWSFDEVERHGNLPFLPSTTSLIEMFCAADHGSVIGFKESGDDKIAPVFRTPESVMLGWGLPVVRAVVGEFVAGLTQLWRDTPDLKPVPGADVRPAIRKVLELFWLTPTEAEVAVWGDFPVEVDLTNTVVKSLAEPVKLSDIGRSAFRSGRIRNQHTWPIGSAQRSGKAARSLMLGFWHLRSKKETWQRRGRWLRAQIPLLLRF